LESLKITYTLEFFWQGIRTTVTVQITEGEYLSD